MQHHAGVVPKPLLEDQGNVAQGSRASKTAKGCKGDRLKTGKGSPDPRTKGEKPKHPKGDTKAVKKGHLKK